MIKQKFTTNAECDETYAKAKLERTKKLNKTNLVEIEGKKKKRRKETKENVLRKYKESKKQRFDFLTEKRPTNL